MNGDYFGVPLDRDGINRTIASLHAAGDARLVPLLRAVRDDRATVLQYDRPQPIPDIPARLRGRPLIAIICDDLGTSYGPSTYDSRALRWLCERARAFIVASALPPVEWYERAAAAAISNGAAVIVDTLRDHEFAWIAYAGHFAPRCSPMVAGDINGPTVAALRAMGGDAVLEIEIGRAPARESYQ
jgi:hypothetical protein